MPAHAILPTVNRLLQQVQMEEASGLPVAVAEQNDLALAYLIHMGMWPQAFKAIAADA
jgi:hypothetical protein